MHAGTAPPALQAHNRFWLSENPHQPKLLHQFFNVDSITPQTSIKP